MPAPESVFGLDVSRDGGSDSGAIRVTVEGELDSASAPRLLESFASLFPEAQRAELILDLARVQFVDSTGLRALIQIEQEAGRRRVPLLVVPAPESVTRLLQMAGVADRLRLVDDQGHPPEREFLERADLELGLDDHAPSRARAAVRELLGQSLERSVLDCVVLLTSELVTNAVTHPSVREPSSTVGLRVVRFPDGVRVGVDDPGEGFTRADIQSVPLAGDGLDRGGRGLFVVDRSATRWGIQRLDTDRGRRFLVWFEIETA